MTAGFGFNMAYTVNFERATVDYDLARGADALKLFELGQSPRVLKLDEPDGYVGELRHITDCIRTDRAPSIVTAQDGLAAIEICEAELRSIETGAAVVF